MSSMINCCFNPGFISCKNWFRWKRGIWKLLFKRSLKRYCYENGNKANTCSIVTKKFTQFYYCTTVISRKLRKQTRKRLWVSVSSYARAWGSPRFRRQVLAPNPRTLSVPPEHEGRLYSTAPILRRHSCNCCGAKGSTFHPRIPGPIPTSPPGAKFQLRPQCTIVGVLHNCHTHSYDICSHFKWFFRCWLRHYRIEL